MTLAKRQFFPVHPLSAWLTMACVGVVLAGCGEKKPTRRRRRGRCR